MSTVKTKLSTIGTVIVIAAAILFGTGVVNFSDIFGMEGKLVQSAPQGDAVELPADAVDLPGDVELEQFRASSSERLDRIVRIGKNNPEESAEEFQRMAREYPFLFRNRLERVDELNDHMRRNRELRLVANFLSERNCAKARTFLEGMNDDEVSSGMGQLTSLAWKIYSLRCIQGLRGSSRNAAVAARYDAIAEALEVQEQAMRVFLKRLNSRKADLSLQIEKIFNAYELAIKAFHKSNLATGTKNRETEAIIELFDSILVSAAEATCMADRPAGMEFAKRLRQFRRTRPTGRNGY